MSSASLPALGALLNALGVQGLSLPGPFTGREGGQPWKLQSHRGVCPPRDAEHNQGPTASSAITRWPQGSRARRERGGGDCRQGTAQPHLWDCWRNEPRGRVGSFGRGCRPECFGGEGVFAPFFPCDSPGLLSGSLEMSLDFFKAHINLHGSARRWLRQIPSPAAGDGLFNSSHCPVWVAFGKRNSCSVLVWVFVFFFLRKSDSKSRKLQISHDFLKCGLQLSKHVLQPPVLRSG